MIEHMEEILVDNQKYEYQVFDLYNYQGSYLLAQQKRNNIVSVCLYSINQIPSKRFYNINYVRKIVKVLRGSTFLRDKYTDMSIFCSKSKRCLVVPSNLFYNHQEDNNLPYRQRKHMKYQ